MALHDLLPLLRQQEPYTRLLDAVRRLSLPWLVGPAGAEKAYLLAALAEDLAVPGPGTAGPEPRRGVADAEPRRGVVLLATPSYDAAERLHDDLLTFAPTLEGSVMVFLSGTCGRTVNARLLKSSVSGWQCSCGCWTVRRRGSSRRSRRCCGSFPRPMSFAVPRGASGRAIAATGRPSSPSWPRAATNAPNWSNPKGSLRSGARSWTCSPRTSTLPSAPHRLPMRSKPCGHSTPPRNAAPSLYRWRC